MYTLCALDAPAPCCGASGEAREMWPGLTASKLLEVVDTQDHEQPDGHRIAVLFFASALEVMLEEVLVEILRRHTTSEALSDAVLDSHQGVRARRELFKTLSGTALGGVLTEPWGQQFLGDWSTLVGYRNKIAHGHYYYKDSNNVVLLQRVRSNFLRAFAELHNHVTRYAGAPPVNT